MMKTLRARLLRRACVDLGTEVPETVASRACQRVITVREQRCEQRKDLEERGYTIVATVGDQWSDFGGGSTGYMVKLPNYLYTIE